MGTVGTKKIGSFCAELAITNRSEVQEKKSQKVGVCERGGTRPLVIQGRYVQGGT